MKKINIKNLPTTLYITSFVIFVIILGALSFTRLMRYYAGSEVIGSGWVPSAGSSFENDVSNTFFGQFNFVNLNGLMARVVGKRELNGVVKMDNGYLNVQISPMEEWAIKLNADNLRSFNDYLVQRGKPFIYVVPTTTSSKYDPKMPEYYNDYGNFNMDAVASSLRDRGIWVLDTRDELQNEGYDSYDMMYRTDHHWNTHMGFYTYCKLVPMLEKELGCEVDPALTDINNYTIERYKNWHLGSRGQRTGKYFAGIDDFDLYVPKSETDLTSLDEDKEGSYMDLLINMEPLETKNHTFQRDDLIRRTIYDRVLEQSQGDFASRLSHNDKHILVIGDSFTRAILPFLDISFGRVTWNEGTITGEEFEELDPDAVIMVYDTSASLPAAAEESYAWAR